MEGILTLDQLEARGKTILVRLDLNLPIHDGHVTDLTRLTRSLPTLKELAFKGAKIIVLAHRGRPRGLDPSLTLAPIASALEDALSPIPVSFCESFPLLEEKIQALHPGQILLLENIRFMEGEENNDPIFVQKMAQWADVYVNDAFSAAHRAHASTEGIAHLLPSYAGRLMEEELEALNKVLISPKRPLMAIVGGAKVSTKLPLLNHLIEKVDILTVGGAMANTFLAALGYDVGASLYEPALLEAAKNLLDKGSEIILPLDVSVGTSLEEEKGMRTCLIKDVKKNEKIFDIGPETCAYIIKRLDSCHALLWNGPLGVFETPPYDKGTTTLAQEVGHLTQEGSLLSVAGGGDTIAALEKAKALKNFTYVSTAGGAFLEWLEGKSLPGVEALRKG